MQDEDETGKDHTVCSGIYLAMLKYLKFSLYDLWNDLSLHEKKIKASFVTTELQLSYIVIATDETTSLWLIV